MISILPFSDKVNPNPRKFKVVNVTEDSFRRGATFLVPVPDFLLMEALQFFNLGINASDASKSLVEKRDWTAISDASLSTAIQEAGYQSVQIYDHIFTVWQSMNQGNKSHFDTNLVNRSNFEAAGPQKKPAASAKKTPPPLLGPKDLLADQWVDDPFMKQIYADKCTVGLLVPRLLTNSQYLSEKGAEKIINLNSVASLLAPIHARMEQFHLGAFEKLLEGISTDFPGMPNSDLTTLWVGSDYTLAHVSSADAGFLSRFTQSNSANEVGLSEKILATLSLLTNEWSGAAFSGADPFNKGLVSETREMVSTFNAEMRKLQPANQKKTEVYQLDRWLVNLEEIENIILYHLDNYHLSDIQGNAFGPVLSDLLWGLLLINYLRLFLLRLRILAFLLSIPFKVMYRGGSLPISKNKTAKRHGIVGVQAILIWELLFGHKHPFATGESAVQFVPILSVIDEYQYIISSRRLRSPKIWSVVELPAIPTHSMVRHSEVPDAKKVRIISKQTEVPLRGTLDDELFDSLSRQLWRIAFRNYGQDVAEDSKDVIRIDFPPRGPFPVALELNPHISDAFYLQNFDPFKTQLTLFSKSNDVRMSLRSRAKIATQLQMYVFSWFYSKALDESGLLEKIKLDKGYYFRREIRVNDGNIEYGGKHPGHKSHYDGYCLDCSLWGTSKFSPSSDEALKEPAWHKTVSWPQLGTQTAKTLLGDEKYADYQKDSQTLRNKLGTYADATQAKIQELERALKKPGEKRALADVIKSIDSFKKVVNNLAEAVGADDTKEPSLPATSSTLTQPRQFKDELNALRKLMEKLTPVTSLVAQLIDNGSPEARKAVYLEFFKRDLNTLWESEAKKVHNISEQGNARDNSGEDNAKSCDDWFASQEATLLGYPTMVPADSHIAHHVAHLAMVLSLPPSFLWSGPIYHLRATAAITSTFLEKNLPVPFTAEGSKVYSLRNPPSQKVPYQKIPYMHFHPQDHFNHWHINYWVTDKDLSHHANESNHFAYVLDRVPFWKFLGVDFMPFRDYLVQYMTSLEKGNGKNKAAEWLLAAIRQMIAALESTREFIPVQKLLGAAGITSDDLRSAMFKRVIDYEIQRPTAMKIGPGERQKAEAAWPPEKIRDVVDRSRKTHEGIKSILLRLGDQKIDEAVENYVPVERDSTDPPDGNEVHDIGQDGEDEDADGPTR